MKRLLTALLFTALFVSACGGASNAIDVTLNEFSFTPSEFTIPSGQKVTITARNEGAVIHEFAIMKLG
jgi:uncharacterized cupredoxin-like copper-binding protein